MHQTPFFRVWDWNYYIPYYIEDAFTLPLPARNITAQNITLLHCLLILLTAPLPPPNHAALLLIIPTTRASPPCRVIYTDVWPCRPVHLLDRPPFAVCGYDLAIFLSLFCFTLDICYSLKELTKARPPWQFNNPPRIHFANPTRVAFQGLSHSFFAPPRTLESPTETQLIDTSIGNLTRCREACGTCGRCSRIKISPPARQRTPEADPLAPGQRVSDLIPFT